MKIAIIGATGNIGTKVVNEALERGHSVTGIARHADKLDKKDGLAAVSCDLADEKQLADGIRGADAVIVSVRHDLCDIDHVYNACRRAGVKRVLVVGGAASLEVSPGVMLIDTPGFPDEIKVQATPAVESLKRIREIKDLDWTFVSPSIMIVPGERTGKFRLAGDELLKDEKGDSRISQEDFAVALIDEVEKPQYIRKRFTVGY